VLVGATASGKSRAAVEAARRLALEIVNCDGSQIYSGMQIGTARPTAEEMGVVPHHLYGVVSPAHPVNAGRYVEMADRVAAEIFARAKTPLFVGGTGLYVRALTRGLAHIPDVEPSVREAVLEHLRGIGAPALHAELALVDPEAAARISERDPQRIARALEVFRQTGRPISEWQKPHGFGSRRYSCLMLGISSAPQELRQRIVARVKAMLDAGFPEEVCALRDAGFDLAGRAFKALGYRDVADFVDGRISAEDAMSRVALRHVQYAKRQATWFRKEPGIEWHDREDVAGIAERIDVFLKER